MQHALHALHAPFGSFWLDLSTYPPICPVQVARQQHRLQELVAFQLAKKEESRHRATLIISYHNRTGLLSADLI